MAKRGEPIERKSVKIREVEYAEGPRQIKVEHYIPEGMGITYVSAFTTMHTGDLFLVTLFQIEPPLLLSPEDTMNAVSSRAVIQLAITPNDMETLIANLQQNLEIFKNARKREGNGGESE